jgi:hypothetical protein
LPAASTQEKEQFPLIKRNRTLNEFEIEFLRKRQADYRKNLKLLEAMLEEARSLGVFPPANPLEGVDVDIRIARIINSV